MRILAIVYSVLFGGVAIWAWGCHLLYGNSVRERLLPDVVLSFITMPLSLLLLPLTGKFAEMLNGKWTALMILTIIGLVQTILLWLTVRTVRPATVD